MKSSLCVAQKPWASFSVVKNIALPASLVYHEQSSPVSSRTFFARRVKPARNSAYVCFPKVSVWFMVVMFIASLVRAFRPDKKNTQKSGHAVNKKEKKNLPFAAVIMRYHCGVMSLDGVTVFF